MSAPALPQKAASWKYLEQNPRSTYKQLFVKGTRIPARVLYGLYLSEEDARSAEQLAADYAIPVDAVQEAIAYCQSSPAEVREKRRKDELLAEAIGMKDASIQRSGRTRPVSSEDGVRLGL